jgi:hypothetical protein
VGDSRPDLKSPPSDHEPPQSDYLLPTATAPLFEFLALPPSPYVGFQGEETPCPPGALYRLSDALKTMVVSSFLLPLCSGLKSGIGAWHIIIRWCVTSSGVVRFANETKQN